PRSEQLAHRSGGGSRGGPCSEQERGEHEPESDRPRGGPGSEAVVLCKPITAGQSPLVGHVPPSIADWNPPSMLGRGRPAGKMAERDRGRKRATLARGAGGPSLDWNPGFDLRLRPAT